MMRIYRPAKPATQSGLAPTKNWLVEFDTHNSISHDAVMGWVSSKDTRRQLRLEFPTLDAAIAFARSKGKPYTISTPTQRHVTPKSYGENFTNPHIRGN